MEVSQSLPSVVLIRDEGQLRILGRPGYTDMRKQTDGLAILVRDSLGPNPPDPSRVVPQAKPWCTPPVSWPNWPPRERRPTLGPRLQELDVLGLRQSPLPRM